MALVIVIRSIEIAYWFQVWPGWGGVSQCIWPRQQVRQVLGDLVAIHESGHAPVRRKKYITALTPEHQNQQERWKRRALLIVSIVLLAFPLGVAAVLGLAAVLGH